MHGNEVENSRGYRFRLVSSLPHLKSLDFSALTIVEKDKAKTCNIVDSFSIDVPAFRLANVTVSLLQGAEEQERGGKKAAREPRSVITCETLLYPCLSLASAGSSASSGTQKTWLSPSDSSQLSETWLCWLCESAFSLLNSRQ